MLRIGAVRLERLSGRKAKFDIVQLLATCIAANTSLCKENDKRRLWHRHGQVASKRATYVRTGRRGEHENLQLRIAVTLGFPT